MMIAQEQAEELARAVRFPAASSVVQTDAAHYLQELQQAQLDADKAYAAAQSAVASAQNALQTAQQAVDSASASAETVAGSVSAAQSAATAAETSADSADTFAQAALSSQQAATGSATAAAASADLAQEWAVKTDGAVADGEYSAKYHAQQAEASATEAEGSRLHSRHAGSQCRLRRGNWRRSGPCRRTARWRRNQGYGAKKYAQDAASSASGAAASAAAAAAAADQAADKVQTDLSNVSASGQKRAGAWALPDYSAGVSMGSGVQKAPADGWVAAYTTGPNDGRNRGIRVGTSESPNLEIFSAGGVGINTIRTRILFPIKKDWYYGPTDGCSVESAKFFPL